MAVIGCIEPGAGSRSGRYQPSRIALDEEGYSKVPHEMDAVLSSESRVVIESTGVSEAFRPS